MKIFKLGNKKDLFDIIKNYSDVCKQLKVKELTIKDFDFLPKEQRTKALAFHQIQNIQKLFNEGWIINWSDTNQRKWYPYFTASGGVLGFGGSYCADYGSFSRVAFYKDEQTSNFVGRTFTDIYNKLK